MGCVKTCAFETCENVAVKRGLCGGHYRQQWRGRELSQLQPIGKPGSYAGAVCAFDECTKVPTSYSLCKTHHAKMKWCGKLRVYSETARGWFTEDCKIIGCLREARPVSFCHFHGTRDFRLWKNFGIGLEDYFEMLSEQSGVCRICGRAPEETTDFHVDHCHDGGQVRGLLCGNCNTAIGLLGDSSVVAESAVKYLRDFGK